MRSFSEWISFFCLMVIALACASVGILCLIGAARGDSVGGSIILAGGRLVFCGISTVVAAIAWLSWKGSKG